MFVFQYTDLSLSLSRSLSFSPFYVPVTIKWSIVFFDAMLLGTLKTLNFMYMYTVVLESKNTCVFKFFNVTQLIFWNCSVNFHVCLLIWIYGNYNLYLGDSIRIVDALFCWGSNTNVWCYLVDHVLLRCTLDQLPNPFGHTPATVIQVGLEKKSLHECSMGSFNSPYVKVLQA